MPNIYQMGYVNLCDWRMQDPNRLPTTAQDKDYMERRRLLEIVSKKGVYALARTQLEHLHDLLELADYSNNEKANRSKKKLLKKINIAIYELYNNM
jgi:hypothetical protein